MSGLQTLIDMGFPEAKAMKALEVSGDNVEQAMEWLLAHDDNAATSTTLGSGNTCAAASAAAPTEADATAAATPTAAATADAADAGTSDPENTAKDGEGPSSELDDDSKEAKSIKCDDCGKLFRNADEVQYHAAKSNHSAFSECTDEKKSLTEEQKTEKLKELEEKLKLRRKEKEFENKVEDRTKEKKRIQLSKDISETKRKYQDDEMRRIAEERLRDKLEDKKARERVKEQIERDRLARKEKFGGGSSAIAEPAPTLPSPATTSHIDKNIPKKTYDTARLQIRLPGGSPQVQEFGAKESLSAVRLWISLNRQDGIPAEVPFNIATTFPRKVFTDDDMSKPLDALGLVPSSVVVITNK